MTPEPTPAGGMVEVALAQLQPIRDLARNWDIDIASCLEDYLNELVGDLGHGVSEYPLADENMDGSERGPPNFTQAAIVLQNSSSIYSRKVEYLYSLVYDTLNGILSSSGEKQQARRNSTGATHPLIEEFEAFDPDTKFLLLDDVYPTAEDNSKIDLVDNDNEDSTRFDNDRSRHSIFTADAVNGTSFSLGGLSVTRQDRSNSMIQNGIPSTITATRNIMGSILSERTDTGGGSLRIVNGRCSVSADGRLTMPGAMIVGNLKSDVQKSLDLTGRDIPVANNDDAPMPEPMDIDDDAGFAFVNDDDDDNEGPGFELAGGDGDADGMETQPAEPIAATPLETCLAAPKPRDDPWALEDPHDPGTSKPRPIRIRKTYRLPDGLKEPPSACVTGSSTRRSSILKPIPQRRRPKRKQRLCIASETFEATMAAERRRRDTLGNADEDSVDDNEISSANATIDSVPLKGLVFGEEFAYIAKAQTKRKAAERREQRKLLMNNPTALPEEEADAILGYDDQPDPGDMDFGGENDSFGGDEIDMDTEGAQVGNTGISSIDDAFSTWGGNNDQDTSNPDTATFEALCRAHLKSFARGAEKYAVETHLSKRVDDWQEKLAPILEEEERRPEFDISKYKDRVIQAMKDEIVRKKQAFKKRNLDSYSTASEEANTVDFRAITKNCEPFDVCRLFTMCLALANSGNVALHREDAVNSLGSIQLELLNEHVDEPMETYLAPSARD